MELVNFSVTNFRSITTAHKVAMSDMTVLIGRNNEGKSNLLKALDIGMTILQQHAGTASFLTMQRRREILYDWDRDFPISFQSRKSGTQTIIRLEFLLDQNEIEEFKTSIKSNLNGSLPIIIKIGKENKPTIEISKSGKGTKALTTKSANIADFIAKKIVFNYIPAVRTDQDSLDVISKMLTQRLRVLESDKKYEMALQTIRTLQQNVLNSLAATIKQPLEKFLPAIKGVNIQIPDYARRAALSRDFEILIDDGTETPLSLKGDGVKSLVALGLLKDRVQTTGASIIAIEEPESHLHPAAIHQLNDVIRELTKENQIVISTHNPLFVARNDLHTNVIVDGGNAIPAKNIQQIRDILGIKASDNLTNASFVLVVEGSDDVIAISALLRHFSENIRKALDAHLLVIEQIGGAGNLPYKLTLLKNALCTYHCLLDNDDAGRKAYQNALVDSLASVKATTFITCNGSPNSEFEDCINLKIYSQELLDKFGVNINSPQFKGNGIWGDRMRSVFLNQGKQWTDKVESDVKFLIASCVASDPANALNSHKRNSIDALVTAVEAMIVH